MSLNENNLNRLAISLIELNKYSYDEAIFELKNLKLSLICGDKIKTSYSLQAALITAVNTAARAFLGGVYVTLPENTPALIPWNDNSSLNRIIQDLGGKLNPSKGNFTLYFGCPMEDNEGFEILCNAWQGGISKYNQEKIKLTENESIPLGGIAAGAIGVGSAFFKVTGIDITAGDISTGISLWKPCQNWHASDACGPIVENLPSKYWILGLGHLGQSYLWNIGLLPYKYPKDVNIVLQDYDRFRYANKSSGLLYTGKALDQYKTRVCASWLEKRNFCTAIIERKFDENTKVTNEEPLLALCGFDSGKSRRPLLGAGFDFIIDCALGGNLDLFDNMIVRTFPNNSKTPEDIWSEKMEKDILNQEVANHFSKVEKNDCGILAETLGNKAISSSFVGAISGSLVVAECIRSLNGGMRYDTIVAQLRNMNQMRCRKHLNSSYSVELVRNGFTPTQF